MNGRNDERDLEDDGFYTVEFDPAPLDAGCLAAPEECGAGVLLLSGVYALDGTRLDKTVDQVVLRAQW